MMMMMMMIIIIGSYQLENPRLISEIRREIII